MCFVFHIHKRLMKLWQMLKTTCQEYASRLLLMWGWSDADYLQRGNRPTTYPDLHADLDGKCEFLGGTSRSSFVPPPHIHTSTHTQAATHANESYVIVGIVKWELHSPLWQGGLMFPLENGLVMNTPTK